MMISYVFFIYLFFFHFSKSLLSTCSEFWYDLIRIAWDRTYLSEKCFKLNWNMMLVFFNKWMDWHLIKRFFDRINFLLHILTVDMFVHFHSKHMFTHINMFKVNGSATKCMNQCKYGRLLPSCNLNLKWPQKFAFLIEWHKKIQLLFNKKFYLSLMLSDPTQIPFSSQMLNKMWTIYDFRIDVWNQIHLCLNLKYEFSCFPIV